MTIPRSTAPTVPPHAPGDPWYTDERLALRDTTTRFAEVLRERGVEQVEVVRNGTDLTRVARQHDHPSGAGAAVRVEELVNYFDYGYPAPDSAAEPFLASVTVAPSPWAEGREIVHIGLQGYEPPEGEEPPLNLVFLVDVSGSMQGPDRLELAQKSPFAPLYLKAAS